MAFMVIPNPNLPWWPAAAATLSCTALALALRPWRAVGTDGPPTPWLAWWTVMPWLWSADHWAAVPLVQPLSGVCLLVLMAGWPLAVLALLPVTLVGAWMGGWAWPEALPRLRRRGLIPATLTVGIGAALRRGLPNHLFVYILGRGFLARVWPSAWLARWPPGCRAPTVAWQKVTWCWAAGCRPLAMRGSPAC